MTLDEKPDGTMITVPSTLDVAVGEQIRFEVRNAGRATHEFMLDSVAHKFAMQRNAKMEHDDPNGKTLDRVRMPDPGPIRGRHAWRLTVRK